MLSSKDVENLAALSRLSLSENERIGLTKDLESILGYVSELSKAEGVQEVTRDTALVRNVMREDLEPDEPSINTEILLSQAPDREGDYLKVKKILGGSDVA